MTQLPVMGTSGYRGGRTRVRAEELFELTWMPLTAAADLGYTQRNCSSMHKARTGQGYITMAGSLWLLLRSRRALVRWLRRMSPLELTRCGERWRSCNNRRLVILQVALNVLRCTDFERRNAWAAGLELDALYFRALRGSGECACSTHAVTQPDTSGIHITGVGSIDHLTRHYLAELERREGRPRRGPAYGWRPSHELPIFHA